MRGIIYKDLCDNFLVWKNLASYLFGLVFIIGATVLVSDSEYYFVLLILMVCLIGTCAMESSVEQDEAANFDRLLISFPVTKEEIVIAKYILGLVFIAVASRMSLIITVIHVLSGGALDPSQAFSIWVLGIYLSLIFSGITYVGYMVFGKRRGTITYVAMIMIIAGAYGAMHAVYGIERFVQMDKTRLLLAGIPVSILVFVLSCMISIRIYKKKFS